MADKSKTRKKRRGRRKKGKSIVSNIIILIALAVFAVSAYQLYKIIDGYKEGQEEYAAVEDLAIQAGDPGGGFRVNFEELLQINPETVGWLRFHPEPAIINYPIVQGPDNDKYLHTTFSANENTLGAIFLNVDNSSDFADENTIIYGHRMNDGSMFRHLEDYEDPAFWEANPRFYIYTPDGRELTYHIYSTGEVRDTADIYITEFPTLQDYQEHLELTKSIAEYDTGIEVTTSDIIVTLSTCVSDNASMRRVVIGVLEKEVYLEAQ